MSLRLFKVVQETIKPRAFTKFGKNAAREVIAPGICDHVQARQDKVRTEYQYLPSNSNSIVFVSIDLAYIKIEIIIEYQF